MPTDYQSVPIPLGGGVDRGKNERAVRPPNVQRAVNVTLNEDGAYVKRRGFTEVTTTSADSPILVRSTSSGVAIFDEEGCHRLQDGDIVDQDFGGLIPTEVLRKPVVALRGETRWDNCSLSPDGLQLGLVCSDGEEAVCTIVSTETWQPLWGPYRVEELAWYSRVEAIGGGFYFFGMEHDVENDNLDPSVLNKAYVTTASSAPTVTACCDIGAPDVTNTPTGGNTHNGLVLTLYDTCVNEADNHVYVVCWGPDAFPGTDVNLNVTILTPGSI